MRAILPCHGRVDVPRSDCGTPTQASSFPFIMTEPVVDPCLLTLSCHSLTVHLTV